MSKKNLQKVEPTQVNVLALGAGVQSSTLAFLLATKELNLEIKAAIFSDTKGEPKEVYKWLDYLKKELPFPVLVVQHGKGLTQDLIDSVELGTRVAAPPFHTLDEETDKRAIVRRTCTYEYKIKPMLKACRSLIGAKPNERIKDYHVNLLMGISLDEIQRCRESQHKWLTHKFPLIDLRMRRSDCFEWMKNHGYAEPPRSACTYCPYHSDHEWRRLKMHHPEDFAEAVKMDKLVRNGVKGTKNNKLFLHTSCKPLDEIDFRNDLDKGQLDFWEENPMQLECQGMCGL